MLKQNKYSILFNNIPIEQVIAISIGEDKNIFDVFNVLYVYWTTWGQVQITLSTYCKIKIFHDDTNKNCNCIYCTLYNILPNNPQFIEEKEWDADDGISDIYFRLDTDYYRLFRDMEIGDSSIMEMYMHHKKDIDKLRKLLGLEQYNDSAKS